MAWQYEKCVELYIKAANISQKLGDGDKFLEYIKLAKEFRKQISTSDKK